MRAKPNLQAGTLTLLLTDIEGSSQLWERHPDSMKEAVARHDLIIQQATDSYQGIRPVEQGEGDSTLTAFQRPSDALACALEIQKAFVTERWPEQAPLRVRAALHTGEVDLRDEHRYWGSAINRCARLRAIAHGGQVLLSSVTRDLVSDRLPAQVSLKDMGIRHLRDLSTPEHVFQLCHPDVPADFPPLLSLEAYPNNLPVLMKSFIPRDDEMEQVRRRLDTHRLVTLTGVGGSGKTRLALQVAAERIDRFQGGVWLVDLATISDPTTVIEAVARAVRVPSISQSRSDTDLQRSPETTLRKALIDYLRVRTTLVILDNCEHLLNAVSLLAANLLENCPDLTLLVTSREALGVDGETPWRIPSMSVPNPDEISDLDKVAGHQAVQLFVERASAARSDFALTSDNVGAVAAISRRFDGLPLAIELAAARVNVVSPKQIASMLDDTFRLLAGGSRTALERQQTMRASIDWSFRLLDDKEQVLLRRLSVFAGGSALDAVEGVCSGDGLQASEVLDLLSHLAEKSLLESAESKGRVGYRLLAIIRQYAAEKLNEAGESDLLRFRHRDFYLRLVEEVEHALLYLHGDEGPLFEAISADHENVRAALDWSVEVGDKEHALRIASSLWQYWFVYGAAEEAWSWMDKALSMEGEVAPELEGKAYAAKANAGAIAGRMYENPAQAALESFDRSSVGPNFYRVMARFMVAENRERDEALEMFGQALEEAQLLAHTDNIFAAVMEAFTRGSIARLRGDLPEARAHFDKGVALLLEAGKLHGAHDLMDSNLPYSTAMEQEDYEGARSYVEKALVFWRERGDEIRAAHTLTTLAHVSKAQRRLDEARSHIAESLEISRRAGGAFDIARVTQGLGEIQEAAGNLDEARSAYSEALHLSEKYESVGMVTRCLWGLARVARAQGEKHEAIGHLSRALRLQRDRGLQADPWVRRLAQFLAETDPETAARLFGALKARAEAFGGPYPPAREAQDYESAVDAARASLGGRFSALWDEGTIMDFDQAVELALKATKS